MNLLSSQTVPGVSVTVIHQVCPVCAGCGTVPADFYARLGVGTSIAREQCRRCKGIGTVSSTRTDHPPRSFA